MNLEDLNVLQDKLSALQERIKEDIETTAFVGGNLGRVNIDKETLCALGAIDILERYIDREIIQDEIDEMGYTDDDLCIPMGPRNEMAILIENRLVKLTPTGDSTCEGYREGSSNACRYCHYWKKCYGSTENLPPIVTEKD